jgi:hypothetical protein
MIQNKSTTMHTSKNNEHDTTFESQPILRPEPRPELNSTKTSSTPIAKFRNFITAASFATITAYSSNIPKAFAQEYQPDQLETQQIQTSQPNQNLPPNYSSSQQSRSPQFNPQYSPYPSVQNRPNSVPTIRVYGDVTLSENSSLSGRSQNNQSGVGYKAGIEVNIPFGSTESVNDINQRERARLETIEGLTAQINKLCVPSNLLLSEVQCKELRDDLFGAIKTSFSNLKK